MYNNWTTEMSPLSCVNEMNFPHIRNLIDSLCRDGTDMPKVPNTSF